MKTILERMRGSKTYAIGATLLAYLLIQQLSGQPIDQEIVYALLGGATLTLRAGIASAEKAAE